MNKFLMMVVIVVGVCILNALPEEILHGDGLGMALTFSQASLDDENAVLTKTFAIPAETVELRINDINVKEYDRNGNFIGIVNRDAENMIELGNSFVMKELNGFTVNIHKKKQSVDKTYVLEHVDFELLPINSLEIPETVSKVFYPLYESMVCNFEESYLRNLQFRRPSMLIIGHNSIATLCNAFITWKKSLGMDVDYLNKSELGSTTNEIKDALINYYNLASNPPDYLILIGDTSGSSCIIPTFVIQSPGTAELDATDLPYTLISGGNYDYFPEMIAGRISNAGNADLITILNKIINYEKNPYNDGENTDWLTRALVVAGNYSNSGIPPVTPVQMSQRLRDLFLQEDYTEVDTIFYPPTNPGTSLIIASINEGAQYVSYRGWGDASGWHYPEFHVDNLPSTNNGKMLPIVTSIVCNTGDFSNENINPCFGEAWMRMGTPTAPNGCVAFVGPSDLHTSTEYNNAISMGMYHGMFFENIRNFGQMVMRGKTELYNNYPNNRAHGGYVEFYYHVYNILSDPSLNLWKLIPERLEPQNVEIGTNFVYVEVPGVNEGSITITRNNTDFLYGDIIDGTAFLAFNPSETGDIILTLSSKNLIPFQQTYTVATPTSVLLTGYQIDNGYLVTSEENSINATFQNFGTSTATNVTATLGCNSEFISIENAVINLGNINANATTNGIFNLEVLPGCPNYEIVDFTITLSTGAVNKFQAYVNGIHLSVTEVTVLDGDGILVPGETADIRVTVQNSGLLTITGLSAEVESSTDAVIINSADITFGNLTIGQTGTATFNATLNSDCYVGRLVRFVLHFSDSANRTFARYIYLQTGIVDNTAPTGPDHYGYFAYDMNDEYSVAPDYQWASIDPEEGGTGTLMLMRDDESETVSLPFAFNYYGETFNQITICSNGWISMGSTWMADFRNWGIPSAFGPDNMISAYWDDLKGWKIDDAHYEDMRVSYKNINNEKFVIQWNDAYNNENNANPDYLEKFQIILYNPSVFETPTGDGEIVFQYFHVNNPNSDGNYCSVGLMNEDHSDGLEYSYANIYPASATPLQDGLAVKFTTHPPDSYVPSGDDNIPVTKAELKQNYPNPFNPVTSIDFAIPSAAQVEIVIYNLKGQLISTLTDAFFQAGHHSVKWAGKDENGNNVSSGIYFYRLKTDDGISITRKMMLLK